jgi:hypothetical protein
MKIKNSDIIALVKLFFTDMLTQSVQYTYEANTVMSKNLFNLREAYQEILSVEKELLELQSSEEHQKSMSSLIDLVKDDHLEKDVEGNLVKDPTGLGKIIPGHEGEVLKIKNDFSENSEYADFIKYLKSVEEHYRNTISGYSDYDFEKISIKDINYDNLKLSNYQWQVLSVLVDM